MYRDTSINKKIEWIIMLKYHMAVMAGVAILAVGSSKLQSGDTNPSTDLTLVKVGIAILTVCWVALVFFAALTLNSRARSNTEAHAESTKVCELLVVVLLVSPFIANSPRLTASIRCPRCSSLHRRSSHLYPRGPRLEQPQNQPKYWQPCCPSHSFSIDGADRCAYSYWCWSHHPQHQAIP